MPLPLPQRIPPCGSIAQLLRSSFLACLFSWSFRCSDCQNRRISDAQSPAPPGIMTKPFSPGKNKMNKSPRPLHYRKAVSSAPPIPSSRPRPGPSPCGRTALPRIAPRHRTRREKLRDAQTKAPRNLFNRPQTRILLNPNLVVLIELVPDATRGSRSFLGPSTRLPQFPQAYPEGSGC
jgi:hypothetical protein